MSSHATDVQIPDDVSEPVRAVVDLFRGPLGEVRFPDVDRGRLEALVDGVRGQVAEVAAARLALQAAQHTLDTRLTELRRAAERAHAYALVYAGGDPELKAQLDDISIGPKPEKKRRGPGRPKKRRAQAEGPELPLPADVDAVH